MSRKKAREGPSQNVNNNIAYQNKDLTAKVLADQSNRVYLSAFGLNLPRIVDARPTNLPAIEANELRIDNVFILEDGSLAIIDYESNYSESKKVKYLGYIARLIKRIYNDEKAFHPIRVIVIYTADVKKGTTDPVLDLGSMRLKVDEAFLIDLNSSEIKNRILVKLCNHEPLSNNDLMQLIIYPLTFCGLTAKQRAVSDAIDLAEQITNIDDEIFVLAGIAVASNKFITTSDDNRIGRMIEMTKVGQHFWERAENSGIEKERKNSLKNLVRIAENFLKKGVDAVTVSDCTGLPLEEIRKIESRLYQNV